MTLESFGCFLPKKEFSTHIQKSSGNKILKHDD